MAWFVCLMYVKEVRMTVWTQYLTPAHLWYGNSSKPFLWGYLIDLSHDTGKKESTGEN